MLTVAATRQLLVSGKFVLYVRPGMTSPILQAAVPDPFWLELSLPRSFAPSCFAPSICCSTLLMSSWLRPARVSASTRAGVSPLPGASKFGSFSARFVASLMMEAAGGTPRCARRAGVTATTTPATHRMQRRREVQLIPDPTRKDGHGEPNDRSQMWDHRFVSCSRVSVLLDR